MRTMSNNNEMNLSNISPDSSADIVVLQEDELEPKQLQAAAALAAGESETQTARRVGVNRTTLYRWYKQAGFVAEMNRLKQEYVCEYRGNMRELLSKATATMTSYLEKNDS